MATAYSNLSLVYNAMGDSQAALRYGQRTLNIRLDTLGNDHPDVGAAYNNLGLLLEAVAESGTDTVSWVDDSPMTPEEALKRAEEYYHQAGEARLRSRSRSRSRSRGRSKEREKEAPFVVSKHGSSTGRSGSSGPPSHRPSLPIIRIGPAALSVNRVEKKV